MSLERRIVAASIDSRLASLADAATLHLRETETTTRLQPVATAWRELTEGDTFQVQFGLRDLGFSDYGTFRVDDMALEPTPTGWGSVVEARDQAALLIDERTEQDYGFGTWPKDDPSEYTYPSARSLVEQIAGLVGLAVEWDAPNYGLRHFSLSPEESPASAIERILGPLRISQRYRVDAWVQGMTLIVRRRGNGPVAGTLDCSKGVVRSIRRTRQPLVGDIRVYGATYRTAGQFQYANYSRQVPSGTTVAVTQDSPNHRVTETGIVDNSGHRVVVSRETEDITYRTVYYSCSANSGAGGMRDAETSGGGSGGQGDERVLGEVQIASMIHEDRDLHTEEPKHVRRVTEFGYDLQYRLVLQEERRSEYEGGSWTQKQRTITRYEQVTPTELRTVVTTITVSEDGESVNNTTFTQGPGTLQSGIRQLPVDEGDTYYGQADGGGARPRVERDDNLVGSDICQQIADDLAAESGKRLYAVSILWPRPFPYRKGQRIMLENLPGGCPDLEALIIAVPVSFDEEAVSWTHTVQLECWRDT